jgi:large subunit ribosomal protein L16
MLQPKRTKFRKAHRGKRRGIAIAGSTVAFGEYGLQALDNAWITARQIEAARRAITHEMRRGGKVWIRIFPDKPVSKKPAETRQGSGKGAPEFWVAVIRRGRMLFEVAGVREDQARAALRLAAHKLPIETRFVNREHQER